MLVGSIAFASSISIPWYIDDAKQNTFLPPKQDGNLSLIYLKSTVADVLTCTIEYFNSNGDPLGPKPGVMGDAMNQNGKKMVNTFTIAPRSALGFRPSCDDPRNGVTSPFGATSTDGGQEGAQGVAVPNRPRSVDSTTPIPGTTVIDQKQNGSITISWTNGDKTAATDMQGSQMAWALKSGVLVSFSHLLPPGK
jgi:hypothetical protein